MKRHLLILLVLFASFSTFYMQPAAIADDYPWCEGEDPDNPPRPPDPPAPMPSEPDEEPQEPTPSDPTPQAPPSEPPDEPDGEPPAESTPPGGGSSTPMPTPFEPEPSPPPEVTPEETPEVPMPPPLAPKCGCDPAELDCEPTTRRCKTIETHYRAPYCYEFEAKCHFTTRAVTVRAGEDCGPYPCDKGNFTYSKQGTGCGGCYVWWLTGDGPPHTWTAKKTLKCFLTPQDAEYIYTPCEEDPEKQVIGHDGGYFEPGEQCKVAEGLCEFASCFFVKTHDAENNCAPLPDPVNTGRPGLSHCKWGAAPPGLRPRFYDSPFLNFTPRDPSFSTYDASKQLRFSSQTAQDSWYVFPPLPSGLSISKESGVVSGSARQASNNLHTVIASDGEGGVETTSLNVEVFSSHSGELHSLQNHELQSPSTLTLQGRSVYVVSRSTNSLKVFWRGSSETLSEVQSYNSSTIPLLSSPADLQVSPDGAYLYVLSPGSDSVLVFTRRDDGTLQEGQHFNTAAWGITSPSVMHVGSRHIFLSSGLYKIAVLTRSESGGQVAFSHMVTTGAPGIPALRLIGDLLLSPDERTLFVASRLDSRVAAFSYNKESGALTYLNSLKNGLEGVSGLAGVKSLAVTKDGSKLYALGNSSLATLSLRPSDEALYFLGAVVNGEGLSAASSLGIASDGAYIYVGAQDGISWFERDLSTGLPTYKGAITGISSPLGLAISPARVYAITNAALTVALRREAELKVVRSEVYPQLPEESSTGDLYKVGLVFNRPIKAGGNIAATVRSDGISIDSIKCEMSETSPPIPGIREEERTRVLYCDFAGAGSPLNLRTAELTLITVEGKVGSRTGGLWLAAPELRIPLFPVAAATPTPSVVGTASPPLTGTISITPVSTLAPSASATVKPSATVYSVTPIATSAATPSEF
ncbi:MAG: beta-propeller fold lactonase family protein [Deltaproteobacteria bacterium]|nr:beta-propeller fold lactonase family protein [Deltaproteobacteria bacterium]